jgi:hypothetical protein
MSEFRQIIMNGKNVWEVSPQIRLTAGKADAFGDGGYGDVLAKIFSHMHFWERARAAWVSRAFYAAYYRFMDNRPILSLMLDGDYLNVIRAFNTMADVNQRMFTNNTSFAPLMILGGTQMVRWLNAMGGIPRDAHFGVCKNIADRKFYLRATFSMLEGKIFVAHTNLYTTCLEDIVRAVMCERYDIARMLIAPYHCNAPVANPNPRIGDVRKCPYPPDVLIEVGCALIAFHGRCVSTTRLCMYHQTHSGLGSVIPTVIEEMHFHIQISVKLLAQCIGRAREANNATDEIWLQRAHPDIFILAVLCATTESTYDYNIRNADLSDTFAVLGALDDDKKVFT